MSKNDMNLWRKLPKTDKYSSLLNAAETGAGKVGFIDEKNTKNAKAVGKSTNHKYK